MALREQGASGAPRRGATTAAIKALYREVAACTRCPTICGYRKFPYEAAGRLDTGLVLVGEAPGIASIRNARHWTGRAGMILRGEIRRLGLDLEDLFFLTNAVKCWPAAPGSREANRAPRASEIRNCARFLEEEIRLLDPRTVVAVGAVAARAVLGRAVTFPRDHARSFRRGRRRVIVLLHPSNANRFMGWAAYRASLLRVFRGLARHRPAPLPVVEVAAALVVRNGRYLITRRQGRQHLAGYWEFPGGKRRPGESLEECLRRELREELAIEVEVGEEVQAVPYPYPDRLVRLHFFGCRLASPRIAPQEGQAYRWVRPEELAALPFPPADAALIRALAGRAPSG